MTEKELLERIAKQNEQLILHIGRIAFKEQELKELVTKGSKKSAAIIKAYNLCNGLLTITQIAKKVGIAQPSMTAAIDRWAKLGIVFKKEEKGAVYPLRLYPI